MLGVNLILLLIVGRVNPFKFVKKFFPAMLMSFSTSSSNATLPTSLECCNELGLFGADMKVTLVNEGPFTVILDSDQII